MVKALIRCSPEFIRDSLGLPEGISIVGIGVKRGCLSGEYLIEIEGDIPVPDDTKTYTLCPSFTTARSVNVFKEWGEPIAH